MSFIHYLFIHWYFQEIFIEDLFNSRRSSRNIFIAYMGIIVRGSLWILNEEKPGMRGLSENIPGRERTKAKALQAWLSLAYMSTMKKDGVLEDGESRQQRLILVRKVGNRSQGLMMYSRLYLQTPNNGKKHIAKEVQSLFWVRSSNVNFEA